MTKRISGYFLGEDSSRIYNAIPKRVWAALAKDFAIQLLGEENYLTNPKQLVDFINERIKILKWNELD